MTAPVIAVLDNDPAILSLMHDLLTEEGYRTLRFPPEGCCMCASCSGKRAPRS